MKTQKNQSKPSGYNALIEKFQLDVVPNWHQSFIADINAHRIVQTNGITEETYPNRYAPEDSVSGQLEFALKYDGTNLGILASIFHVVKPKVLEKYIQSKPKGKYARRLWFFYEMLTGKKLAIDDLDTGGYIDVLESNEYYTLSKSQPIRRQRINNNLLGDARFCPMIRRTETLKTYETSDLTKKCRNILTAYPPQLLKRAMSYLYTKETKSSFEIEHLKPSSTRTERFIALLHSAETEDFCTKANLLELQNRIVDERFQDTDYRNIQNYIGESVSWQYEKIHYIPPRPEIVPDLMAGLACNPNLSCLLFYK
ncbi:MAG: hypothetical protein LBU65_15185 [Planctomycetaceae bacterium]|jgi:hypothetical protein|nr:hypothetical protein [Planctomycetaceae bacterium]